VEAEGRANRSAPHEACSQYTVRDEVNLIDHINRHRYLYLTEVGEPEDNVLRLVIVEARIGRDSDSRQIDELVGPASTTSPIVVDDTTAAYEVIFEQYIAYAVLNETFTIWDDAERFEGNLFRIYSESKFLAYVGAGTIASADDPGPFKHYGVVCLNHIVEVASTVTPSIRMLRRSRT
jgi:hypothetical protein